MLLIFLLGNLKTTITYVYLLFLFTCPPPAEKTSLYKLLSLYKLPGWIVIVKNRHLYEKDRFLKRSLITLFDGRYMSRFRWRVFNIFKM